MTIPIPTTKPTTKPRATTARLTKKKPTDTNPSNTNSPIHASLQNTHKTHQSMPHCKTHTKPIINNDLKQPINAKHVANIAAKPITANLNT